MDQNTQYQMIDSTFINWINQYQILNIPIWVLILFSILWYLLIIPGLMKLKNLPKTHPKNDDPYLKGKRMGYITGILSRILSIIILSIFIILGFLIAKILLSILIIYYEVSNAKHFVTGFWEGVQSERTLESNKQKRLFSEGKLLSFLLGTLYLTFTRGIFIVLIFLI